MAKKYPETISENIEIFRQLIDFIKNIFENSKIVVLVMPFNPLFRYTHKANCIKTKRIFYDVVEKYDLKVIDDFNLYNSPFLFDDHCHMNVRGGLKYTKK